MYGERADLLELHKDAGGMRLSGFVAALAEQGPTRGPQNVFINRRIVKDRTIAHAIIDAYSVASIKERSPEVHLFIEMPPDALDVNVHPTKAEVRFREQSLVHEVVRRAFIDALGQSGAPQLQLRPEHVAAAQPAHRGAAGRAGERDLSESVDPGCGGVGSARCRIGGCRARVGGAANGAADLPAALPDASRGPAPAVELKPMIPLGQFRDTFIIAVDDEGLAIIDQHVAHERVLFERVMQRLTGRPARIAAAARADDRSICRRRRTTCSSAAPPNCSGLASRSRASATRRSRSPRCRRC